MVTMETAKKTEKKAGRIAAAVISGAMNATLVFGGAVAVAESTGAANANKAYTATYDSENSAKVSLIIDTIAMPSVKRDHALKIMVRVSEEDARKGNFNAADDVLKAAASVAKEEKNIQAYKKITVASIYLEQIGAKEKNANGYGAPASTKKSADENTVLRKNLSITTKELDSTTMQLQQADDQLSQQAQAPQYGNSQPQAVTYQQEQQNAYRQYYAQQMAYQQEQQRAYQQYYAQQMMAYQVQQMAYQQEMQQAYLQQQRFYLYTNMAVTGLNFINDMDWNSYRRR